MQDSYNNQEERNFTATSTREDEGSENALGLTRDETLAVVVGLLGGLGMLFGLARCTPIWDQLTGGKLDLKETAAEVVAPVASVIAPKEAVVDSTEMIALSDHENELEDAELTIDELESELAALRKEISSAPEQVSSLAPAPDTSGLEAALSQAEADAAAKASLVADKDGSISDLEEQNAKLLAEKEKALGLAEQELKAKQELEAKLAALMAEKEASVVEPVPAPEPKALFAESSEDLAPRAQTLFAGLQDVHTGDTRPDDIKDPYMELATSNKAKLLYRIPFATGQSGVGEGASNKLTGFINESGEDDFFLVVGYADVTGSADANKSLSRERSTSVADVVKEALDGGDNIQAAYVGQTDRFSADDLSENRVVEVWSIAP